MRAWPVVLVVLAGCGPVCDADGDGDKTGACGGADCDDADPGVSSLHAERCDDNDHDDDCNGATHNGSDVDGDGFIVCARDCDDGDPSVNPDTADDEWDMDGDGAHRDADCDDCDPSSHADATEVAGDGIDNDCDGDVDEGTPSFDDDRDGFSEDEGDCDDADPSAYPGAPEVVDGVDNDCDGDPWE